jgi:hypothetical protein
VDTTEFTTEAGAVETIEFTAEPGAKYFRLCEPAFWANTQGSGLASIRFVIV